jgi:hypothetical protein
MANTPYASYAAPAARGIPAAAVPSAVPAAVTAAGGDTDA